MLKNVRGLCKKQKQKFSTSFFFIIVGASKMKGAAFFMCIA